MKSEIAILFWLSQGLQWYETLESTTSGLGVMSRFASVVAIAPPMGRFGWDFDTFSSIFGLPIGKVSSFWALRFGLHVAFYGGSRIIIIIIIIIIKILTITIGILHFMQEPLIKAASSIKRGSCFEGIRVCFYGLGQPWFIADSETHRKWTTGSQKHTHTHVQLFIDNYWSRESRE